MASSLYPPRVVGGAELVARDLAEAYVQQGHEVYVYTLSENGLAGEELINGVHVCRLPYKNLYEPFDGRTHNAITKLLWHVIDSNNRSMYSEFSARLEALKPDVLQTHSLTGLSTAIWSAAKRHGVPVCHVLHDNYLLCPRTTMFRNGHPCISLCAECRVLGIPRARAARSVDAVIGVSEFILRKHTHLFSAAQYKAVIYNGCSIGAPLPLEQATRPLRPLILGYLGRLHETKGISWLLDALAAPEIAGQWHLKVGGTGRADLEFQLRKQAKKMPVEWLGRVEPREFLEGVDYLVVPSLWHEPAGRVIQESLSVGTPVIGSNVGGIPELIGDAGIIVETAARPHFANLVGKLVADVDRHRNLAVRALERAQCFSPAAAATQHLSLLESINKPRQ